MHQLIFHVITIRNQNCTLHLASIFISPSQPADAAASSNDMGTQADQARPSSRACADCGRVFSKTSHLLRHSRSHAAEKPYNCTVCAKGFARTDALLRHERTMHSVKRRRTTESDVVEGTPDSGDSAESTSHETSALASSEILATDNPPSGWYGEQPPRRAALSPTSAFVNIGVNEGSVASSGNGHASSQSSFFSTFTNNVVPSSDSEISDLLAEWLNQDPGSLGTDPALASLFPELVQTEHMPSGGDPFPMGHTNHSKRSGFSRAVASNQGTLVLHGQHNYQDSIPETIDADGDQELLSRPMATFRSSGRTGTMLSVDTWESGLKPSVRPSEYMASCPGSPPAELTSPDQVVAPLDYTGPYVSINTQDKEAVIPSLKFLDVCLHLYFRTFHPSLPVIHKPTFQRDGASWRLLLSMCSIGCMFIGTQAASASGRWIYQRLHLSTVLARDSHINEETRLAIALASLLGQSFSFLHGQPQQMLTAEWYHEALCSQSRRNGLFNKINANPITYETVEHLEGSALKQKWRQWARHETLRRATMALAIQGAELTLYSGVARMIPAEATPADCFSDALFEAEDEETWRAVLKSLQTKGDGTQDEARPSDTPETFLPMVLLSQSIVHLHMLRHMEKTPLGKSAPDLNLSNISDYLMPLAEDIGILSTLKNPRQSTTPPHIRSTAALWHYNWLIRLCPTSLIEEVAGRAGPPAMASVVEVRVWVKTPAARLATLHCGHILHYAAGLNDLGFLLPRVIFQATVVLLCYTSFARPPLGSDVFDATQVVEWQRLGSLLDFMSTEAAGASQDARSVSPEWLGTPEEHYLVEGTCAIRVPGYIEGKDKQMDIFSLRSASNLLLRRCTPWGIGATLGDILSNISFQ